MRVALTATGEGFQVDYERQETQSGLLYKLFESRRTRERAHFCGLSVAQIEYGYATGRAIWITLCCTPESDRSTHLFGMPHTEGHWAPAWLIRLLVWPLVRRVARQDQVIVEHQYEQRSIFPARRDLVMPFDIVRPHLERGWEGRADGTVPAAGLTLEL